MPPTCFARLRTAALAAAALFPATAFIGGCNGNSKSAAAAKAAAIAFAERSLERVKSHAVVTNDDGMPMAAWERLQDWPIAVIKDVRERDRAWQPCEVEALRNEAAAMLVLAQDASEALDGRGIQAVEFAAATFPGASGWRGADGWPGWEVKSTHFWPRGVAMDLWQLRAVELFYCGLLKTSPVEWDSPYAPTPHNVRELRLVTTELWSRRKCRLDQLALRRDGAFGTLLPAATVETCDTLIEMELADMALAKVLQLGTYGVDRHDSATTTFKSLQTFAESGSSTAERFRDTRAHVRKRKKKRFGRDHAD